MMNFYFLSIHMFSSSWLLTYRLITTNPGTYFKHPEAVCMVWKIVVDLASKSTFVELGLADLSWGVKMFTIVSESLIVLSE